MVNWRDPFGKWIKKFGVKNIDVLLFALAFGIVWWLFDEHLLEHVVGAVAWIANLGYTIDYHVHLSVPRLRYVLSVVLPFTIAYIAGFHHARIKEVMHTWISRLTRRRP